MLIPTLYKTRLPREFSYPIGAEALSEQLAGVPQFSEFRICFSDVVSAWKSKFQQMITEGADYEIVTARLWSPFEILGIIFSPPTQTVQVRERDQVA